MQKFVGTIVAAAVGAFVWQAMTDRPHRAVPQVAKSSRADDASRAPAIAHESQTRSSPPAAPSPSERDATHDPGLASFVDQKYRFLTVPTLSPELREALERREALAVRLNTLRQARIQPGSGAIEQTELQLAQAEERIRQLMHPSDYAEYSLLRDANTELYHLREYAGGISHVLPLSHDEERAVLFAKLTYKQQYEQALRNSALERSELPVWQRLHAYERVAHVARVSRSYFLQQARQSLHDEEQFALLSNYEHTELDRELTQLHLAAMRR